MQANTTFRCASHGDGAILDAFKQIAEDLGEDPKKCLVTVVVIKDYQRNHEFQLAGIHRQPFAKHAVQHESASWECAWINLEQLRLQVRLERDWELGDDKIRIWFEKDPDDPVDVSRALTAVQKQFVPLNRSAAIERALGPEMAEFYRLREGGLSRLEALTRKLVKETHDYRLQLDAEMAEHRRALDESFANKGRALEESYEGRKAELKAREDELNKLRKELDDRSARHARREQSRALQKKISDRSENFTLTPATQKKRQPVHVIFIALLGFSAMLVIASLVNPVTAAEGPQFWLGLGRLPLGALGFALTAVFYIRWTDQWFRQHANQEFRLHHLALDVDRAGYATEMLMEWQEDKGGEMPAVLVDRLTAGLFTDHAAAPRVRHPSEDATAALLKAASSVRIEVPGLGEVALTGRGIRSLDKNLGKQGKK